MPSILTVAKGILEFCEGHDKDDIEKSNSRNDRIH